MNNIRVIILCLFIFLCFSLAFVYGQDYSGMIKLKSMDSSYRSVEAASEPLPSILGCLSLKVENSVQYLPVYSRDEIKLTEMEGKEKDRVRRMLLRFATMHMQNLPSCFVASDCDWRLIVHCQSKPGVRLDGRDVFADLPSSSSFKGIDVGPGRKLEILIKGSFYLVNVKTNKILLHDELTGCGAVVDTAIDDFAEKMVLRFSRLFSSAS